MRTAALIGWQLIWCVCLATPETPQEKAHPCRSATDEYHRVLDAYFTNARGSGDGLVILRVYGGFVNEYEITLDPKTSTLVRYTPKQSIWGNAYSMGRPHQAMDEYVKEALNIPYERESVTLGKAEFSGLFDRGIHVNTNVCESWERVMVHDALRFEIIRDSGRVRATVTDTSGLRIRSQNSALLEWALAVKDLRRPANDKEGPTFHCYNHFLLPCRRSA